jgi:hypothetical protein
MELGASYFFWFRETSNWEDANTMSFDIALLIEMYQIIMHSTPAPSRTSFNLLRCAIAETKQLWEQCKRDDPTVEPDVDYFARVARLAAALEARDTKKATCFYLERYGNNFTLSRSCPWSELTESQKRILCCWLIEKFEDRLLLVLLDNDKLDRPLREVVEDFHELLGLKPVACNAAIEERDHWVQRCENTLTKRLARIRERKEDWRKLICCARCECPFVIFDALQGIPEGCDEFIQEAYVSICKEEELEDHIDDDYNMFLGYSKALQWLRNELRRKYHEPLV